MAQDELSPKEVLGLARPISGRKTVAYDPLERIPTLAVGDLAKGDVICGYFAGTERLVSAKFTMAQEKEDGKGVQYRHVLKNDKGVRFGIWNTGELKLIFSRLVAGTYVEVTYMGKETNDKGQEQHRFTSKIDTSSVVTN